LGQKVVIRDEIDKKTKTVDIRLQKLVKSLAII
jgi:hypothetical protein